MAVDLTAITAEVANNSSVTGSVLTLVQNLVAQIAAIPPSTDPVTQAALDALTATLSGNDGSIAAAVEANTPGEHEALIWEYGSGCLEWCSGPFLEMNTETFTCDDCGEEKPRLGSMKLVPIDRTIATRFVCADCVKKYDIHKPH